MAYICATNVAQMIADISDSIMEMERCGYQLPSIPDRLSEKIIKMTGWRDFLLNKVCMSIEVETK